MRGEVGENEVFQKKDLVIAWINHKQLKITCAQLDQEVVVMNEFFIKTFVLDFLDELIIERGGLQRLLINGPITIIKLKAESSKLKALLLHLESIGRGEHLWVKGFKTNDRLTRNLPFAAETNMVRRATRNAESMFRSKVQR